MPEKYEFYMNQAENLLGSMSPEHPELSQAWMMGGIGYALLAIAHELWVIEQVISKEAKSEKTGD